MQTPRSARQAAQDAGFVFDTFLLSGEVPSPAREVTVAWGPNRFFASISFLETAPAPTLRGWLARGYVAVDDCTYRRALADDAEGVLEAAYLQTLFPAVPADVFPEKASMQAYVATPNARSAYAEIPWGAPWTRWLLNGGTTPTPGLRCVISLAGERRGERWESPDGETLLIVHGEDKKMLVPAVTTELLKLGFRDDGDEIWLRMGPVPAHVFARIQQL